MTYSPVFDVAVVGATGAVGEQMIAILEQRGFPTRHLYPLASSRSAGKVIRFHNKNITVEDTENFDFKRVAIALFSAGGSVSAQYAPSAARAGCVVIDNSSHFRYEDDIPLIIPEINPHRIADYKNRNIIANPNCSTMQLLMALKPIYDKAGINRINIATYQAASGAGALAVEELAKQTTARLSGNKVKCEVFPVPLAFNCIPHIDPFQENGYTKEEMKIVWETRKILEDDSIAINPTAVRVPVFYGHAEAAHIETRDKLDAATARQLLAEAPGVCVIDEHANGGYPTQSEHAVGNDDVFVGRIRDDISHPLGLNMWIVSDNIRKGAALNAVQIAEMVAVELLKETEN